MNELLTIIPELLSELFTVWCIILYYCSIKKCFLRGNKSKAKLFWFTMFVNPVVLYIGTVAAIALPIKFIARKLQIEDLIHIGKADYAMLVMIICTIAYLLLIFLFSNIIGKWLGTSNKSLVMFVSLTNSVLFSLSLKENSIQQENLEELKISSFVVDILGYVVLFLASFLTYRFVILPLSKLTDSKHKVNSNLFIIPPSIFIICYGMFSMAMIVIDKTQTVYTLIAFFSSVILFLFIWAFSVIIQNINATHEAIEAKDLAAEMARAEARIEADLAVAKSIQTSALPSIFPPFPERTEFELFASMNAAKEVGGDFYDFYMLNENTLGFLIADVSGKSIPGAMFMMTAKTVIKSLAESGLSSAEVFTQANEKLCEGNEAEMFVTAWLGYLDLNTGLIRVANAGHNPPVLIHNGKAEYVVFKPALMLAGMEGIRYKEQTLQLEKGDILYLFTDGVTEAMNQKEELYGEKRLKKILSFGENYPEPTEKNGIVESVCRIVSEDITKFADGAEQSDDITMLCIRYL